MGFYGKDITIDGIVCGILSRGIRNGEYRAVFEREHASLEQIEAINWARPEVKCKRACDKILPEGYGFTVEDISYDSGCRAYTVTLRTDNQYLGDVTSYQAQLEELRAEKAAQAEQINGLEQQLAEADEAAIALYDMYAALSAAVTPGGEEDAE